MQMLISDGILFTVNIYKLTLCVCICATISLKIHFKCNMFNMVYYIIIAYRLFGDVQN